MKLSLQKLRTDYKAIYKKNHNLAIRLWALVEYEKINLEFENKASMSGKRLKLMALCHGLEISLRTLQRWRASYIKKGIFGVLRSKRNGRHKKHISTEAKILIGKMRADFRWGPEVIQAHLKYDHIIELSQYKINRYLNDSGLRQKYPCITVKMRKKKLKKHDKVVVVDRPGKHTQIDVNHQRHLVKAHKSYIYNFVDHASNWSYKRAYKRCCPKSTVDFLKNLLIVCPFIIENIQSDNGTEFTYKYISKNMDEPKSHPMQRFCKKHAIVHRLIIPGEKELQGLVERSHRQDSQELLLRIAPKNLSEFNGHLSYYYRQRNCIRRYKKLGWKTPNQWLENYIVVTIAIYLCLNPKLKALQLNEFEHVLEHIETRSVPEQIKQIRRILNDQNKVKKSA